MDASLAEHILSEELPAGQCEQFAADGSRPPCQDAGSSGSSVAPLAIAATTTLPTLSARIDIMRKEQARLQQEKKGCRQTCGTPSARGVG